MLKLHRGTAKDCFEMLGGINQSKQVEPESSALTSVHYMCLFIITIITIFSDNSSCLC